MKNKQAPNLFHQARGISLIHLHQQLDAEAAETVKLRHAGENATLSDLVSALSEGMNKVFELYAEWMLINPGSVGIQFHKDFYPSKLSPEELSVLMQMLQSNSISYDTYFYNLERGEMYPEGHDKETELALISNGSPAVPPRMPEAPNQDQNNQEENNQDNK